MKKYYKHKIFLRNAKEKYEIYTIRKVCEKINFRCRVDTTAVIIKIVLYSRRTQMI